METLFSHIPVGIDKIRETYVGIVGVLVGIRGGQLKPEALPLDLTERMYKQEYFLQPSIYALSSHFLHSSVVHAFRLKLVSHLQWLLNIPSQSVFCD
jgi:hypothetical protein